MDEQTITAQQDEKTGAQGALPENATQDAAALAANEQKTNEQTQEGDATASLPTADEKLVNFAKGVGIEDVSVLSERELKLLKIAKDNQAEFQRTAQKASQLEKTMTQGTQEQIAQAQASGEVDTAQMALARVQALELSQSVNNFFTANPEAKEHEEAMVNLVTERPEIGQLVRQGALSLNDLHAMVVGGNGGAIDEAKVQGGQQALQQLANKQLATAVPGAATTSALTPPKKDRLMELWEH